MKKQFFFSLLILLPGVLFFLSVSSPINSDKKYYPGDWFHLQRAYPANDIPVEKYHRALKSKALMQKNLTAKIQRQWQQVGPKNVGGRVTALAVNPNNPDIIIAGAAAGGIFKTTNGGITWSPKTDFMLSLSIGALRMDPNNSQIIYCGTGEANISTDSYAGIGMLKSTDGGDTWFHSGLENSRHIAEIEVHPLNSNIIYVAVSGGLYSKGPDRGIYKSTDAGATWTKSLYINDSTSAIDVAIDPIDPQRVYAAMWERLRGPTFRKAAGISTGIFLSTDGGISWNRLANGLPAQSASTGRISIAVAPSNPSVLYALLKDAGVPNGSSNTFGSFYKSTNKGQSWTLMPSGILPGEFSSFGWYFGCLEVDPIDANKVYIGEIDFLRSTDGGNTWSNITNSYSGTFDQQHPDQHALWINPANSAHLICGNDGGVFISFDNGSTWSKAYDLPISQFYSSGIDYQIPSRVYGGTQDNGTLGVQDGNPDNWLYLYGGDGFFTQVDYTNSNIIYAESQFGGISRSTDAGVNFQSITSGIDFTRTNWSTPYILDPFNPSILYLGTYKLHKSTNRGTLWSAISGDLTRGANGRLGTITAIAAGRAQDTSKRVLYVATDDAKLSVSTNSGQNWIDRTGTLPRRYMTDVVVDLRNSAVAYVTLSGYNLDETNPHIFKTTDYGLNWIDISGNLPDVPVNSFIIDYDYDSVFYVGTDAGVFYTVDAGVNWMPLGIGLPNSPVFDLNFHAPSRVLYAATHGRSIFVVNVDNITGVEEYRSQPASFSLEQNYPNPFNPVTKIAFHLSSPSEVSLIVYDVNGTEVKRLAEGFRLMGEHVINFNAEGLPSGIYFYRLTTGKNSVTKKMVLIK